MMSTCPTILIDIWSDLACPWCYVGKRRLDKAIDQCRGRADFKVIWHPYMIDHGTNKAGEEYLTYNKRRWGTDSWTQSLRRSGLPDGAIFKDWKWWPHTLKAHRLVLLAEQKGRAAEAQELLFQAIYERGQNVSDATTLNALGQELGLTGVEKYLESAEGQEEVLQEDARAKQESGAAFMEAFQNLHKGLQSSG
ncbi:g9080 [Coccomyxa elongata]